MTPEEFADPDNAPRVVFVDDDNRIARVTRYEKNMGVWKIWERLLGGRTTGHLDSLRRSSMVSKAQGRLFPCVVAPSDTICQNSLGQGAPCSRCALP